MDRNNLVVKDYQSAISDFVQPRPRAWIVSDEELVNEIRCVAAREWHAPSAMDLTDITWGQDVLRYS